MVSFRNVVVSSLLAAIAAAAPASDASLAKRQSAPVIYSCSVPGTIAVTFDDGPFIYTEELLSILAAGGVRATFFLNGANWGNIWDYQGTVQRMINEGHQVGSHTWSHADLATLDAGGVTSQMTQLGSALQSIIGKQPTYMRPPYFSYSAATLATLGSLGYKVIQADIDTNDWANQASIYNSVEAFRAGVSNGGSISLEHDVHEQTVHVLAGEIIKIVNAAGLRAVPVGECLGDPAGNWYR